MQALLKSKNRCLAQLILITEDALRASGHPEFENRIATFDEGRTAIFRAIELVDQEITKVAPVARTQSTAEQREGVRSLIEEQQQLISSLQSLDSRLLESLESAVQAGQRELQSQNQAREKINRFKSSHRSESGEGLDQTL